MKRRLIIGGNWKMYKTPSEATSSAKALRVRLINVNAVDVVVFPAFPNLVPLSETLKESRVKIGGQNLHWEDEGAFTGEVSARMLRDAGCDFVIVGHSERRHVFGETNQEVNRKIRSALRVGLKPIFCVGETIDQRRSGETQNVIEEQVKTGLSGIDLQEGNDAVIAYEPVWAIGTGENATPDQAEEVHLFIRNLIEDLYGAALSNQLRIQYGGSVKPGNAQELMGRENIDGALVGGASLDADSFTEIIKAAERVS